MIKVVGMLKKKNGMTTKEFADYWREKHAPLGFRILPEECRPVKYLQNYALDLGRGGEPPYDGVAESYFDDMASFNRWNEWFWGEGGKPLRDDEDNFIDKSKRFVVIVEEREVSP